MAIISCRECDNKVSDAARFCIYCGMPDPGKRLKANNTKVGFLLGLGILFFPFIFTWFTLRNGYSAVARAVAFAWLSFVFLFILVNRDNPAFRQAAMDPSISSMANRMKSVVVEIPQFSTTATDMAWAYKENTVAADTKFKGKRFRVIGTINDINPNFLGNPFLVLDGGVNAFSDPQFDFDKSDLSTFAHLHKAMRVSLICTGQGDIVKTPLSDNCSMEAAQ